MKPADRVIEGFRLAPQQARLWSLPRAAEAYLAQAAWVIEGQLDASRLRRAVGSVVRRHDILRTKFPVLPGASFPLQVVSREEDFFTHREADAEGAPDAGVRRSDGGVRWSDAVERALEEEAGAGFSYEQGPPLRTLLLRLGPGRQALIMTLPAACADGRTLHLLAAELGRAYRADEGVPSRDGGPAPEDEAVQYVQFSEWQHEELAGLAADGDEDERAYWHSRLRGSSETLTLPEQKRFGPDCGMTNALWSVRLSGEEAGEAEALARRHETSLETVLLAAWSVVVWRLTRQRRFTLGYLCDGRRYEELRGVAGLLARWVPLTCELAPDDRLEELLRETARAAADAEQRQYSFTWEADAEHGEVPADGARGVAGAGRLSLGFQYEERPRADWGAELEVRLVRQRVNTDHLSLYLLCAREADGGLCVEFHYDADSFAPGAVETLADQFLTVLRHAARSGPALPAGDLELLGERQRHRLLYEWNAAAAPYPQDRCLHQLIAEQAARTPDAVAVSAAGEEVTYAELDRRANQLAHYLSERGVGPEQRVGVLLERSVEMVVALLGVLKAGGAYVPLEADGAADRLRYVLDDARVSALLTEERLARDLSWRSPAPVLRLDALRADISAAPEHEPEARALPDNLVYVIYTSGSTGRPKGTLVTHRGAVNYLHWAAREYAQGRPLDALVHSPIAFDLTVTSLYVPLLVGGRLLLAANDNGADALIDGLRQPGAEAGLLKLTPAHLEVLRQEAGRGQELRLGRVLVVGGEALFGESLKNWRERGGGPRIINEYGPTEAVVGCCVYDATAAQPSAGPVPIGRPIANTRMYVLDEDLRPAAVGVVGELYIGGAGVARGYLDRPGLTAEKFLPDPFADAAGERLYRTGDLGRHLSGGDIEYLGRADSQVKVRGFRVELGEIEAALLQHPAVREAVVVARRDGRPPSDGGRPAGDGAAPAATRLVAYLVADAELSPSAWRDALRDRLPDYMIPSAFVVLDELPVASNGKVDRRALPAPEELPARGAGRPPLVAPRNLTEEILASIWAEVLGVEPVGVEDNFFDLGGDSMRSIQIRARAQRRGLDITHEQLFQYRTISQLARVAGFDGAGPAEPTRFEPFALVSTEDRSRLPEGLEDAYPLAMLQAGMVFHSEFNPEAAIFHDLHSFHLHARFDAAVMERAVREVSARHPVLRTSFELSRFTQPLQLVHANVAPPLSVSDLRGLSPEEQEGALAEWMAADKRQHFVWDEPPLLRFHAHRRADDSFQFTMSFHHAILDGWSAASLLTELFGRYLALLEDEAAPAAGPLAASFRDFVALEQEALDSAACKQYWKEQLAEVTVSRLPRLRRPAAEGAVPVEVREVVIPAEVSEGLKRLASAASIPVKSVLLAAHLKVMSLVGGVRDVVTGLVYNGRPEEADGEKVLGLFLNTLPLRLDLAGGTWRELAERVFEQERDSLPFRRYPLAELQRLGTGQPLFETSFNFMHYYVYQSLGELSDVQLLGYSGYEETNFTLTANFSLDLLSGQVRLGLNYHPTELTARQVEAYGGYYLATLTAMATAPESPYHLHDPLSAAERSQLLFEWNRTATPYEQRGQSIHRLVEEQAARTPDATALVYGSSALTYAELDRRANRLARRLRELGVGREARVGVMLERSFELVVSLLAVLKAGGAYLPLDPQYPPERLSFMLEDGGAGVLITSEGLRARAQGYGGPAVVIEQWEAEQAGGYPADEPGVEAEPEQLAYVIYTSGSTGRPKGVMNTHGAILNRLLWMQDAYRLTAADRVLQKTPFSFDVSVWELFWPLMFGAQMVVAEPGGHQDSRYMAELIAERRVTVTHFVPSMLSLFVEEEGAAACRSLRQIISSGEALGPRLAARVRERLPWAELDNLYGPTEAAVDVSWWRCESGADMVPIGRPIANLELYVLDRSGQPAPVGVAGELHIGGAGLARGYAGRAGLTAEKFTPHPFSAVPGSRLYRTGDLARFLPDGNVEYLGRLDHQVKIRGFRIELGEIEAALMRHEGVREAAAVVGATGGARGPQLLAYFVARPDAPPSASELREHLLRTLPDYMVPSHFIALDRLPLTPNGKLARQALPQPEGAAARESGREYVAPRTETERALAEIWAEVLGVERVGVEDNFFELGGHSLLATQVITRLRNVLQVALPLRTLFVANTVAALAGAAEQQRLAQPSSAAAEPAAITSSGATDIDKLLEEFEALSPAEVEAMLGEERTG
ncbi:MAG TPA: amino acid adenylation domain-containing protein [Pyrinomonadaceae bacterium]|nr:amino acid adenylation domain-containing protein [Pyrinomonadaceae bacterium]